jgi:hypothetical protein
VNVLRHGDTELTCGVGLRQRVHAVSLGERFLYPVGLLEA